MSDVFRKGNLDTDMHIGEHHVKAEITSPGKDPAEARREPGIGPSLAPSEEFGPDDTLNSDSALQGCERINSCCALSPVLLQPW